MINEQTEEDILGVDPRLIPWDEFNQFEFVIYPDHLTVITNANEADFKRAVDLVSKAHEQGEGLNIDSALNKLGFAAVACWRPTEIPVIQF